MKHAAPPSGVLRRVALPLAATTLLLGSTFALSTGSAGAAEGGGNESCADGQTEIKFEAGELTSDPAMSKNGFTVTISDVQKGDTSESSDSPTAGMGSDIRSFDFLASEGLVTVIVKGGTEVRRVSGTQNADGTFSGNDISAAINPNNGKPFGVSNVKFCFAAGTTQSGSPSASTSTSPSASPTASMSVSPSPSASVSPSASTSASPSDSPTASMTPAPTESGGSGGAGTTGTSPAPTQSGGSGGAGTTGATGSPTPTPTAGSGDTPTGGGSGGGATTGDNPVVPQAPGDDEVVEGGGTSLPVTITGGSGGAAALPRTGGLVDTLLVVALWAFGAGMVMIGLGRRRPQVIG